MALKLEVRPPTGVWTDVTNYLIQDTWYIQEEYGRQGSTAYFELYDEFLQTAPHETNLTLLVKPLGEIKLTDTTLGQILFAGLMSDPQLDLTKVPMAATYQINCRDYTMYADSRLVTKSYLNESAGAILTDVINNSSTGLTPDPNMPAGPNVTAVQFDYQSISDAADQLSQLASWQSDYAFYVDYDMTVYWGNEAYEIERVQRGVYTPITISDAVVSAMNTLLAYVDKGAGLTYYEWDGSTIRTKAVVRGGSKSQSWTDTWAGDGHTTQWPLTFDVDQSGTMSVTVNGVVQTIEVTTDPTHPNQQFMLYQAANGQWSLLVGTGSTPGSGQPIVLTYTAQVPIIGLAQSPTDETQYDGPNGGVFEVYIVDNTLKDSASCHFRALSEIQQFGEAQERVTVALVESFPGHIRAGRAFVLQTNYVPDARNNWNVGFSDYFIATSVRIAGMQAGRRQYTITGVRFYSTA